MADQILSQFVGKLLDYLAVPVGRQFSYLFCYNGNLEEFRSQLRGLEMAGKGVKLRVEDEERNGKVILPNVEDWLKRVDAASDESQRFVGEEDAISKCCFNGSLNLKVRYQRSRKAVKKAAEFDKIKKDGSFDVVAVPAPPLPIGFMKNEIEFDFESRRSVFNEIMATIKDDEVEMIGIWGMPGIGKTMLVKRVAKYAEDEGLFEVVAMAVVSQTPNVKAIQGQIADTIGLKLTSESEGGRAGQLLQRLLGMKKILVILDDIWDRLELNDIGIPSGSQHKGCKIILTSRKFGVCEKMRAGNKFQIDILSPNEALDLFLRTSNIDDRSSEKGRLAEELSEECGRLPLAIVIVARELLNKEPNDWTDMLNRLRNSDLECKVQAAIELSFNKVDREEEKMFFLLCALFPEDYEIRVQWLFEYGIGLNLFEKVNNVDQALVRAHNLASSLKSSCLLLDAESEGFVKMHDVVRDAALAIASEGKNAFLVGSADQWREWPKKTAISLWSCDVNTLPDALECPQLQILMMNSSHPDLQLHDNFFAGMKNLIVLDMSEMKFVRLPQSFAGLEKLRTLRLSECELGDVSAIGKLQNLVSVSFYDSDIEVLPKEVGELSNLTFLDLTYCRGLKGITPGVIQNLSQLEVLCMTRNNLWSDEQVYSSMKNTSISELVHLSHLMILEIHLLDASMLPDEVLLGNLTKFNVSIGEYDFEWKDNFYCNSRILKLRCISDNELTKVGIKMLMKKAQELTLEKISGISVALPSPLGGFRTLKKLIVSDCEDVNYVLEVSESEYEPETPLQLLHLIDLPLLKEISKGKFPSLFLSKLKHLRLHKLPRLVHLWQLDAKSVSLDNLTFMSVKSCDQLEYVFEHSSAKSLLKLEKLKVEECGNLQAIYLTKGEEQDNVMDFPQLSHLKLLNLENLTSFGSKLISESTLFDEKEIFRALQKLDINNLEKLEKIWHIHTLVESFFQLRVLKLTQCPKLLIVFPPRATSALWNLEEICIENCDKLETLFQLDDDSLTVGDEMILFPRLLMLKLVNLPELKTLLSTASQNISQITTVNFPILKSIHVEGLDSVKKIWHNNVSTKCFSQLQQLHVSKCDRLVEVFPCHLIPNLHCLEQVTVKQCNMLEKLFQLDSCPVNESKTMTILKQLKILNVNELPELRQIWWTNEKRCGVKVIFPVMEIITLCRLHNLESIVDQQLLTFFPKLKELQLNGIGRVSSTAVPLHIIKGLETLEKLKIEDNIGKTLPTIIAALQSLTSLNFYGCSCLKSLLTPSTVSCLMQLQELFVNECEIMESIIGEIDGEQNFDKVIEFSKLRILNIENLPCLISFYDGEWPLKFPCLDDISIKRCSQLRTFTSMTRETLEPSHQNFVSEALFGQQVSFGRLRSLKLEQVELMEEIWHRDQPTTTVGELIFLEVKQCDRMLKIFPSNLLAGLQNLKALYVESCASLEHVFEVKDHPPFLSNLENLRLDNLPKLKQLWWNENTCESFGLPSLRSFWLSYCPTLQYVFDASVASHLENLSFLDVEDCSSIVEIVEEKPGRKITFPLLEVIFLINLPCFKGLNQYVEFPRADDLYLERCLNVTERRRFNLKRRRIRNQLRGYTRLFENFVE